MGPPSSLLFADGANRGANEAAPAVRLCLLPVKADRAEEGSKGRFI
ncbi:hypothetical protein GS8_157 [Geobacillus stearothermophilus]|uniref:Uncharacterized protein n=1 Tax=Geobacillus stearothermophilus TaxID=1422 RepID=A0ABQ7HKD9_GEOSE|nr:hypothetical protein GS8_157 [Geobacillus stearothermophilus]